VKNYLNFKVVNKLNSIWPALGVLTLLIFLNNIFDLGSINKNTIYYFVTSVLIITTLNIEKLTKNIEVLNLSVLIFIFADVLTRKLKIGEVMYLGRSLKSDAEFSSYIGDSHLVLFNYLVRLINNLNLDIKMSLNIISCFWLLIIILKSKEIFGFDNRDTLLLLLLLLNFQTFFAAEFFFSSIEGKIFAYLSLFTSLLYSLEKKISPAFFYYSLSIFLHASVAIVSFPVLIFILIKNFKINKILRVGFGYFILCLPFLIYILQSNLFTFYSKDYTKELLEYLISFRLPHHLYPFDVGSNNLFNINTEWIPGFIFMLGITILYIINLKFSKSKLSIENNLNLLVLQSLAVFWLYVAICKIFPISKFVIAYPFRITTSILFLTYIFIILKHNNYSFRYKSFLQNCLLVFLVILTINNSNIGINNKVEYIPQSMELENKLIELEPEILFLPNYDIESKNSYLNSIEFRTGIPTYAAYRFNVFFISNIEEWRKRINMLQAFYEGDCDIFDEFKEYYFLDIKSNNDCGNLVYDFEKFYIYKSD